MQRLTASLSDEAILTLLGQRLRALRLNRNRSAEQLAAETQLSRHTLRELERGHGKLENLVATLRALNGLEALDAFLPEPVESPLELARRQGKIKVRKRASTRRGAGRPATGGESRW